MSAGTLNRTVIVRHPETDEPVGLVEGTDLPEWAVDLVHADDVDGGKPARKRAASKSDD